MKKNGVAKKKGKTDISENISKQSLDKIKYVPITTTKKNLLVLKNIFQYSSSN